MQVILFPKRHRLRKIILFHNVHASLKNRSSVALSYSSYKLKNFALYECPQFIQPTPTEELLNCFQFSNFINNDAFNILIHISLCTCLNISHGCAQSKFKFIEYYQVSSSEDYAILRYVCVCMYTSIYLFVYLLVYFLMGFMAY